MCTRRGSCSSGRLFVLHSKRSKNEGREFPRRQVELRNFGSLRRDRRTGRTRSSARSGRMFKVVGSMRQRTLTMLCLEHLAVALIIAS